jgi:hypothetical protein
MKLIWQYRRPRRPTLILVLTIRLLRRRRQLLSIEKAILEKALVYDSINEQRARANDTEELMS